MSPPSRSAIASGGSASAVYSQTYTGWHVLKVEGYSEFKSIGVGVPVKSRDFTVGWNRWCITFFPDGFSDDAADWICVELELASYIADIKTSFALSLLDGVGEPLEGYSRSTEFTFTNRKRTHGFREFIRKEDLESSFLRDDSFQIKCDVVAHLIGRRDIPTESASAQESPSAQRPKTDEQWLSWRKMASNISRPVARLFSR